MESQSTLSRSTTVNYEIVCMNLLQSERSTHSSPFFSPLFAPGCRVWKSYRPFLHFLALLRLRLNNKISSLLPPSFLPPSSTSPLQPSQRDHARDLRSPLRIPRRNREAQGPRQDRSVPSRGSLHESKELESLDLALRYSDEQGYREEEKEEKRRALSSGGDEKERPFYQTVVGNRFEVGTCECDACSIALNQEGNRAGVC
ncbi:hypothetical protein BDY24DRAFT_30477 [Mrakia frigida]|uniref:uncharacterized protein n=1 Tax=Mrakia frigida TaxID=29902 RepID=UPI003FCC0700